VHILVICNFVYHIGLHFYSVIHEVWERLNPPGTRDTSVLTATAPNVRPISNIRWSGKLKHSFVPSQVRNIYPILSASISLIFLSFLTKVSPVCKCLVNFVVWEHLIFKFFLIYNFTFWIAVFHIRWVPCHHGMGCPQVADGGDGLQLWRVAANALNKQSRIAGKGWFSSSRVGRGANGPSP
jgi:hypothetical protein